MSRFLSWLRDLRYRTGVLRFAVGDSIRIQTRTVRSVFFGMVSVSRWFFMPHRYSIAHSDETARGHHKFGYRWYPDNKGRLICTGCKTGRPMDFLEFALEYSRWDPASAHEEMLSLIERGDAEDSEENKSRWSNIPPGAAIFWTALTPHPPHSLPMIAGFAHDGEYYSTCLSHIGDMRSWEFELFKQWAEELVPEWELDRRGNDLIAEYTEDKDIMAKVNPYAFVNPYNMSEPSGATLIYNHEEDDDE